MGRLVTVMNLAEITSFEQLLGFMMEKSMMSSDVIQRLWGVFASKKRDMPPMRRRAALMVLSMLGRADTHIIETNIELLRQIGLADYAKEDLILARYICVALQQLGYVQRHKGMSNTLFH